MGTPLDEVGFRYRLDGVLSGFVCVGGEGDAAMNFDLDWDTEPMKRDVSPWLSYPVQDVGDEAVTGAAEAGGSFRTRAAIVIPCVPAKEGEMDA